MAKKNSSFMGRLGARVRTFTSRVKLPGWAIFALGVFTDIPDWKSRFDYWIAVTPDLYGGFKVIYYVAPYLSPIFIIAGFAYILFVGEPPKGIKRYPALPYIGWGIFGLCATILFSAYLLSVAESKKLQQEVIAGWSAAETATHELLERDITDKLKRN